MTKTSYKLLREKHIKTNRRVDKAKQIQESSTVYTSEMFKLF